MQVEAGQLVVYDPGYKAEVGKVKRINPHDPSKAFVWYSSGDTASCTNLSDLYPIDEKFARKHKKLFENGYALEDIIKKEVEGEEHMKKNDITSFEETIKKRNDISDEIIALLRSENIDYDLGITSLKRALEKLERASLKNMI